ncbi:unnamed protein product, partial [Heterotrigona itama]
NGNKHAWTTKRGGTGTFVVVEKQELLGEEKEEEEKEKKERRNVDEFRLPSSDSTLRFPPPFRRHVDPRYSFHILTSALPDSLVAETCAVRVTTSNKFSRTKRRRR